MPAADREPRTTPPDPRHLRRNHPPKLPADREAAQDDRFSELCHCLEHCSERHRRAAAEAIPAYGERALAPLERALLDSDDEVRSRARTGLLQCGSEPLPLLAAALDSKKSDARAAAAEGLAQCGTEAVEPLCRALCDREPAVRARAAQSLARIADPRAIQPLLAALRRGFAGGSGRSNLWIGMGVLALVILFPVAVIGGSIFLKAGCSVGLFNVVIQSTAAYFRRRKEQNRACLAITETLAVLAEKDPRPELSRVVVDLEAVAADRLQFDPATRQASRAAARRIGELTAALESLPVSAGAPDPPRSALPQPAAPPEPSSAQLPRAAGPSD